MSRYNKQKHQSEYFIVDSKIVWKGKGLRPLALFWCVGAWLGWLVRGFTSINLKKVIRQPPKAENRVVELRISGSILKILEIVNG